MIRKPTDEIAAPMLRLAAGFIDLVLVYAIALLVGVLVAVLRPIDPAFPHSLQLAVAYFLLFVAIGGPVVGLLILPKCLGRSTVGQFVMRVRTVQYPSLDKIGLLISFLVTTFAVINIPLTILLSLIDEGSRLWYDRLTGTAVVRLRYDKPPFTCF